MLAWAAAMGRTIRRTAVAATLAALLLTPAASMPPVAHAGPYEDVFADFQSDGAIDACRHSEAELREAKGDIPNDIEDYARDFPGELDVAIEQRAGDDCKDEEEKEDDATGSGGAAAPVDPGPTATAPAAPPAPEGGTPQPPGASSPAPPAADNAIGGVADRPAGEGGDIPAPLVALAAMAILLALALLVWSLARLLAWEPRWLPGARHAVAEAGWRTGGAWSDFSDWVRGRRTA